MVLNSRMQYLSVAVIALTTIGLRPALDAQRASVVATNTLPDGPLVFDSSSRGPSGRSIAGPKFRVVPLKGLTRAFALAFLPNGDLLITERAGRLRIVRQGVLDPLPISGMPQVLDRSLRGLNDIALHPHFTENRWVYFTYYKPGYHPWQETEQPGYVEWMAAFDQHQRDPVKATEQMRKDLALV